MRSERKSLLIILSPLADKKNICEIIYNYIPNHQHSIIDTRLHSPKRPVPLCWDQMIHPVQQFQ